MKIPLRLAIIVVASFVAGLFVATFSPNWKGKPGTFSFEAAGPMPGGHSSVISIINYFISGRRAVDFYVQSLPLGKREQAERVMDLARSSTVRVDFVFERSGKRTVHGKATGILVDGRKTVVTAGHLGNPHRPMEIWVTTNDGARLPAHPLSRDFSVFGNSNRDWAVLEIDSPVNVGGIRIPTRRPKVGDLVIAAGFPGQLGVNPEGRVASSDTSEAMSPLFTLARVESASPLKLSPVAGSVPLGGMSGGPILGLDGSLNGIFVSVGKSNSTGAVTFFYGGASADAFADALNSTGDR